MATPRLGHTRERTGDVPIRVRAVFSYFIIQIPLPLCGQANWIDHIREVVGIVK